MLEIAGLVARDNKRKRITPRHLRLALHRDEELHKLLGGVTIAVGGVYPGIHQVLLPNKKKRRIDAVHIAVAQPAPCNEGPECKVVIKVEPKIMAKPEMKPSTEIDPIILPSRHIYEDIF